MNFSNRKPSGWKPASLWHAGGRDDETVMLDLHRQTLWPATRMSCVECCPFNGLRATAKAYRIPCSISKKSSGTIITAKPDEIWGTDMTTTVTVEEGKAAVFVAVDRYTTECIGIHASKSQSRFEALEPLRQGVREKFGAFVRNITKGLKIRHDHGSQYVADDFQDELKFLGMIASPSFVREPQGNGCAERFIQTLKENLQWVKIFETVEELRWTLLALKKS